MPRRQRSVCARVHGGSARTHARAHARTLAHARIRVRAHTLWGHPAHAQVLALVKSLKEAGTLRHFGGWHAVCVQARHGLPLPIMEASTPPAPPTHPPTHARRLGAASGRAQENLHDRGAAAEQVRASRGVSLHTACHASSASEHWHYSGALSTKKTQHSCLVEPSSPLFARVCGVAQDRSPLAAESHGQVAEFSAEWAAGAQRRGQPTRGTVAALKRACSAECVQ